MKEHLKAEQPLLTPPPALAPWLTAGQVAPRYGGRSLANLPPTIGSLLGVRHGWVAPPLLPSLRQGWEEPVERVVLLLLDGIGWRRMWEHVTRHDPAFPEFLAAHGGHVVPITSVSPSTTSVATTTLWCNGAAPAEHGLLGFSALLPSQQIVANLLFWHPVIPDPSRGPSLNAWGLEPETFLPVPGIAEVLAAGGVRTTALMPADIHQSPLSRMQMRGAEVHGFDGAADGWARIEQWLLHEAGPGYLYAYDPRFDTASHRDGPESPAWSPLWSEVRAALERLLQRLPARARRRTLLLVTADHGHAYTPPAARHLLADHLRILPWLRYPPGGEPRHIYLYVKPSAVEEMDQYLHRHLEKDFQILRGTAALDAGLYGPPTRRHPEAEQRLGDRILIARGQSMLWTGDPALVIPGMHGALDPEEMIVPLIAFPLDQ